MTLHVSHHWSTVIPIPNVLAGVLIGVVSSSWTEIALSSVVWPVIYCIYVWILEQHRVRHSSAAFNMRGNPNRLLFGSGVATFWAIEFVTALSTAGLVATIAFAVKRVFA